MDDLEILEEMKHLAFNMALAEELRWRGCSANDVDYVMDCIFNGNDISGHLVNEEKVERAFERATNSPLYTRIIRRIESLKVQSDV